MGVNYSEGGKKLGFRVVVVGMPIVMVSLAKMQSYMHVPNAAFGN